MKLREIKQILEAELFTEDANLHKEVTVAFASDLMSDVLARVHGDVLLITGLANLQTIRTAEMKDIKSIIFVRGKKPDESMIELAKEMDICLMSTKQIMFTSCGILHSCGVKGADCE